MSQAEIIDTKEQKENASALIDDVIDTLSPSEEKKSKPAVRKSSKKEPEKSDEQEEVEEELEVEETDNDEEDTEGEEENDEGDDDDSEIKDSLEYEGQTYTAEEVGNALKVMGNDPRWKILQDMPEEAFDNLSNQFKALKVAEVRNIEAKETLERANEIARDYNQAMAEFSEGKVEIQGMDKRALEDLKDQFPEAYDYIADLHATVKTNAKELDRNLSESTRYLQSTTVGLVARSLPQFKEMTLETAETIMANPNHPQYYDVKIMSEAMATSRDANEVVSKLEKFYGTAKEQAKKELKEKQENALKNHKKPQFTRSKPSTQNQQGKKSSLSEVDKILDSEYGKSSKGSSAIDKLLNV